jgi:hypothetical protein
VASASIFSAAGFLDAAPFFDLAGGDFPAVFILPDLPDAAASALLFFDTTQNPP